jgi:hypothetical protein
LRIITTLHVGCRDPAQGGNNTNAAVPLLSIGEIYEGIGVRLIHDDLIEEDSFLQLLIKGFIRDLYAKHLPQFVIMISEDAGIVGRIFVSNGFVRRSSPP